MFTHYILSGKRTAHALTAVGVIVMAGCVQTNAALMDNGLHLARTCPAGVRLYSTPSKVQAQFEEVAILNSSGLSEWTNESQMMESMRKKAAELGATGVIMDNIKEASEGAKVAAQVLGGVTQRRGKSVAIYVPSDTARVAAVCSGRSVAGTASIASQSNTASNAATTPPSVAPQASKASGNPTAAKLQEDSSSGTWSQVSVGRPMSGSDREAAVKAFEAGNAAVGRHEWDRAELSYQRAILLDGSVAKYHAAMGSLMMLLHRWADAEASYTAAMLIDVDNADYRRYVKEARLRR
jgi:hypothetical protein